MKQTKKEKIEYKARKEGYREGVEDTMRREGIAIRLGKAIIDVVDTLYARK